MTDNRCKIWPEFTAEEVHKNGEQMPAFRVLGSPRAGGHYAIEEYAAEFLESMKAPESELTKARLTTWLINQRKSKVVIPYVTPRRIHDMQSAQDLSIPDRCNRLRRKLEAHPTPIINVTQTSDAVPGFLAWSESVEFYELRHLIFILHRKQQIHFDGESASVTEAGRRNPRRGGS